MKKFLLLAIFLLIANLSFSLSQPIQQGKDYTVIAAPVGSNSAKHGNVDVKEFFSFTCIHCKDVEPLVQKILVPNKKINLERIQVPWDSTTEGFAKLNATLYQFPQYERLYTPVFNAVFAHQNLNNQTVLQQFLKDNKLTSAQIKEFMGVYNSFTVATKVGEYKQLMDQYHISGTPTFIVANKYVVKPAQPQRLIEVVQYLVKLNAYGNEKHFKKAGARTDNK